MLLPCYSCSLFVWLFVFPAIIIGHRIINLDVPSMVVISKEPPESIVLQCDYVLEKGDTDLVVKWHKDGKAVYQWIQGRSPSVFPLFKNVVNETYEVSADDNRKYSGLALIRPDITTTGVYKCIVQTARSTSIEEKRMQIIDISNYTLQVHPRETSNETQIECTVDHVYPQPTIKITHDAADGFSIVSQAVQKDDDGYFTATTVAHIDGPDDDGDDGANYGCIVYFREYPLRLTATAPSSAAAWRPTSKYLIAFVIILAKISIYQL